MHQTKQEAWNLFRQNKVSEALDLIASVCRSDEADAEAMYLLGSCHARLGDYKKSIHYFKESLAMSPNLPYTHVAIGGALDRIGRKKEAKASYKKAIQLNPEIGEAHFGFAEILASEGNTDIAKKHYIQACKYLPTSGAPHYKLGLLARATSSKSEEVLPYFRNAFDREPNITEYQRTLAECLLNLGQIDEARLIFSKILKSHPYDPVALGGITTICVKNGEYTTAEKNIDKILKYGIYTSEVASAFLLVCNHLGRCNEAIEYAKTCLSDKHQPKAAIKNIHMQLGAALDKQKHFNEAWQHIVKGKGDETAPDSYDTIAHKIFIDKLIDVFGPG